MIQVMAGSSPTAIVGPPTTSYTSLLTGGGNTALERGNFDVIGVACRLRNIFVRISAAPGVGNTRTATLRVNEADTAVTFTIAGLDTFGSYTAGDLSLSVGDIVSLKWTGTGTPPSAGLSHISYEIETPDPYMALYFGGDGTILYADPYFCGVFQHGGLDRVIDGGPGTVWNVVALTGQITGYRILLTDDVFNLGVYDFTFTIYKSTDHGVTFVAQDGSGGTPDTRLHAVGGGLGPHVNAQHTTSFQLQVTRGDLIYLRIDRGVTGDPFTKHCAYCFTFLSSEAYAWPLNGNSVGNMSTTQTQYAPIWDGRSVVWEVTEAGRATSEAGYTPVTMGREIVWMTVEPGVGESRDFLSRRNGADQSLHILLSDLERWGEDNVHSFPLVFGDTFGLKVDPTSAHLSFAVWGYVQQVPHASIVCEFPLPPDGGSACANQMDLPADSGGGAGAP